MINIENIKSKNIFFKMGVMCGEILYTTAKFNDFEKMMQEAERINNKYKSDMRYCTFVFQAFKDASYDFSNSCFFQTKVYVNNILQEKTNIAEAVLAAYEKKGGEGRWLNMSTKKKC